ncbi:MAG: AraC family transcriptional regulator [Marinilabiliales bacterium]|nr:MAG: AraC family transcriptional regulator [Marinilabiliales bacterium]
MELEIVKLVSLLIVFANLLLAAFLFTVRTENLKSNIILAAFLLVSSIDSDRALLMPYVYENYPALALFFSSLVFLKSPLLFLYILSVTYSDFKFQPKHLWHLVLFILINIMLIPGFYSTGFEKQMEYLQSMNYNKRHIEIQLTYIFLHIQIFLYLFLAFLSVNRYRKILLENYSNASLFNYKFLFQFLVIFTIGSIIATFKNIFMFFSTENVYYISLVITVFIGLVYIIWLVMKALKHPELFRGVDSKLQLVSSILKDKAESDINLLEENHLNKKLNEDVQLLTNYMTKNKPYLDPSLSIYQLAKQLDYSTKDLSVLINNSLNQHFFDFVNGYRIREAMELLSNTSKKEFTILEILYDVGFNSKSSFNTAFKKHSGLTPTEYRKKHLK